MYTAEVGGNKFNQHLQQQILWTVLEQRSNFAVSFVFYKNSSHCHYLICWQLLCTDCQTTVCNKILGNETAGTYNMPCYGCGRAPDRADVNNRASGLSLSFFFSTFQKINSKPPETSKIDYELETTFGGKSATSVNFVSRTSRLPQIYYG